MGRSTASAAALATALAMTLGARETSAYCRSTTCDEPDTFASCDSTSPDCIPLTWARPCIGWSVQQDASVKVPFEVVEDALKKAFGAWQDALCEIGSQPGIRIENLGAVRCDRVEYNKLAGNTNVVVFRDDEWPHIGKEHNIALTTVTYDVNTGMIYDADIEVNSSPEGGFTFTWGTPVEYDLVSVLTHEAGHFLGLAHSSDMSATMYREYIAGSIAFRDLADDDRAAICEVYPPFMEEQTACNPIPRHGFSPECAASQMEGTCSAAGAMRSRGGGAGALSIATGLLLLARRRRAARRGA